MFSCIYLISLTFVNQKFSQENQKVILLRKHWTEEFHSSSIFSTPEFTQLLWYIQPDTKHHIKWLNDMLASPKQHEVRPKSMAKQAISNPWTKYISLLPTHTPKCMRIVKQFL